MFFTKSADLNVTLGTADLVYKICRVTRNTRYGRFSVQNLSTQRTRDTAHFLYKICRITCYTRRADFLYKICRITNNARSSAAMQRPKTIAHITHHLIFRRSPHHLLNYLIVTTLLDISCARMMKNKFASIGKKCPRGQFFFFQQAI